MKTVAAGNVPEEVTGPAFEEAELVVGDAQVAAEGAISEGRGPLTNSVELAAEVSSETAGLGVGDAAAEPGEEVIVSSFEEQARDSSEDTVAQLEVAVARGNDDSPPSSFTGQHFEARVQVEAIKTRDCEDESALGSALGSSASNAEEQRTVRGTPEGAAATEAQAKSAGLASAVASGLLRGIASVIAQLRRRD